MRIKTLFAEAAACFSALSGQMKPLPSNQALS